MNKSKLYTHIKSGESYWVTGLPILKVNGVDTKSVLYHPVSNPNQLFVRTEEEFHSKFIGITSTSIGPSTPEWVCLGEVVTMRSLSGGVRTMLISKREKPKPGDWVFFQDDNRTVKEVRKLSELLKVQFLGEKKATPRKIVASNPQLEGTHLLEVSNTDRLIESNFTKKVTYVIEDGVLTILL